MAASDTSRRHPVQHHHPKPVKVTHLLEAFACSSCRAIVAPPIAQCERGHPVCPDCLPLFGNGDRDEVSDGRPNSIKKPPPPSSSPSSYNNNSSSSAAAAAAETGGYRRRRRDGPQQQQQQQQQCRTCSRPFSSERNMALEGLASVVPFPCRFASEGCPLFVNLSAKSGHEVACPFQLLPCPFCAAMLKGSSRAFLEHLGTEHTEDSVRSLPIQLPVSTSRVKDAAKNHEKIQEFTVHSSASAAAANNGVDDEDGDSDDASSSPIGNSPPTSSNRARCRAACQQHRNPNRCADDGGDEHGHRRRRRRHHHHHHHHHQHQQQCRQGDNNPGVASTYNRTGSSSEAGGDLLILTVMTRPDHDQILYMMQIFKATAPASTMRYRLTFTKDSVATLSYVGIVHSWVTRKDDIADRGECLALPKEFFLNSLFGGHLEVDLIR